MTSFFYTEGVFIVGFSLLSKSGKTYFYFSKKFSGKTFTRRDFWASNGPDPAICQCPNRSFLPLLRSERHRNPSPAVPSGRPPGGKRPPPPPPSPWAAVPRHDEQHQVGSPLRPTPAPPRCGGGPASAAGRRRVVPLHPRPAAEAQDAVAQRNPASIRRPFFVM